jgi:hypothetical protein
MVQTFWNPNNPNFSQVDTLTGAGTPAAGNTISATINTKSVTYTLISGDTVNTAIAGLLALLQNASICPPEFNQITWTSNGTNVITGTATVPGTPFVLTSSATGGGMTLTRASSAVNISQSDVNSANNWLRNGSPSLPQNTDDVVVSGSSVPLLWNLDKLAAVQFNTFTRWQSFTGAIGLPEVNPLGYIEYLPTYFQFSSSAPTLNLILGYGSGTGPGRERYNVGAAKTDVYAIASGSALDQYNIRFLGTHASNTLRVQNVSLGVATAVGEVANLVFASVDGGGTLVCGAGVVFTSPAGELIVNNGAAVISGSINTVLVQNGGQLTQLGDAQTIILITAQDSTTLTWLAGGTIANLNLWASSTFDKSQDLRPLVITNSQIEGDTCTVLDPNGVITWTNPAVVNGQVTSGPFQTKPGRQWQII